MAFVFSGRKIKELRMGLNLTIAKMARICGISRMSFYEIEGSVKSKRSPNVKFLEKIMAKFPISPDYFFVRTDVPGKMTAPKKGSIYFVQDDMGRVKIGVTKSLNKKAGAYMNLPFKPKVLYSFETLDRYRAEFMVHERFADKKIRGEWFSLDQDDIKFIKSGNLKESIESMIE